MMDNPKIYVASPYGFSEAGKVFLYYKLLPVITSAGFDVLDPWKLTDQRLIDRVIEMPLCEAQKAAFARLNRTIGLNNDRAIIDCDGLVAVLDGAQVDDGVASEVGYAVGLGKTVFG